MSGNSFSVRYSTNFFEKRMSEYALATKDIDENIFQMESDL